MGNESFFKQQTILVAEHFEKWHYSYLTAGGLDNEKSRFCVLFDIFYKREEREDPDTTTYHNCIGCNFEEGSLNILDFVKQFSGTEKVRTYLTIYSLLFYTLTERLAFIYKELGVVSGSNFDWTKFPQLRSIKHWANFFKHPKAYMFLHHPSYFLDNDPEKPNFIIGGTIDSAFVDKFYRAGADNNLLQQNFENKKGFIIVYPDLLQFTKDLCSEFDAIIPFISKEDNLEKLRKYTVRDY